MIEPCRFQKTSCSIPARPDGHHHTLNRGSTSPADLECLHAVPAHPPSRRLLRRRPPARRPRGTRHRAQRPPLRGPLRSLAQRAAACRLGGGSPGQLPGCARTRRHLAAAHRGHRPTPGGARLGYPHSPPAAVPGAALGCAALVPVGARGPLPGSLRLAEGTGASLWLRLHPQGDHPGLAGPMAADNSEFRQYSSGPHARGNALPGYVPPWSATRTAGPSLAIPDSRRPRGLRGSLAGLATAAPRTGLR